MKNKPLVIFGTGQLSEIITFYLKKMNRDIYAYCVDKKYYKESTFKKKKIITTEKLFKTYKPKDINVHIAITYKKLNELREKKYLEFKKKGYFLESFINNKNINYNFQKIGQNCFIIDTFVQPFVKIYSNVYIWSGTVLGHNSVIKSHAWISSGTAIGGNSTIEENCFLGMNSTIGHFVKVGKQCFIGAGSLVTSNVKKNSLVIQKDSNKLDFSPRDFMEINSFR
jgi:sugar O-acyltransferase (sialic acid O-acetyltransferase NeuD family)